MRAEDPDRLARLDEERFVVVESAEDAEDPVERLPGARGAAGAPVHDQVVRPLGHLGVEVVLEHPEGRLLRPAAAGERRSAGRAHAAGDGGHESRW